jgi:hypothetical protein
MRPPRKLSPALLNNESQLSKQLSQRPRSTRARLHDCDPTEQPPTDWKIGGLKLNAIRGFLAREKTHPTQCFRRRQRGTRVNLIQNSHDQTACEKELTNDRARFIRSFHAIMHDVRLHDHDTCPYNRVSM